MCKQRFQDVFENAWEERIGNGGRQDSSWDQSMKGFVSGIYDIKYYTFLIPFFFNFIYLIF